MVKFSRPENKFERIENEFYRSFDPRIHKALNYHLEEGTKFAEPCAGYGDLIFGLQEFGHECVYASEMVDRPEAPQWVIKDAMSLTATDVKEAECIITNPPWKRSILHPMITHLSALKPTWLIFEADWAHTIQSIPYMQDLCTDIVSVGRLIWIEGSKVSGTKDCAWYRFSVDKTDDIRFHPRVPKG